MIRLYELPFSFTPHAQAKSNCDVGGTHHMTAPVPARTLSTKLGRYSSLSVLSVLQPSMHLSLMLDTLLTVDHAINIVALGPTPIIQWTGTYGFLLIQHIMLGAGDESRFLHAPYRQERHG